MTHSHPPLTIWLFDIDGVLIHPGGYRAALKATVNYFSRQMGLGDLAPDDDTIQVFEACKLTSEWDSASVCVAAMVAEAALADPTLEFAGDFWRTAEAIRARGFSEIRPDYRSLAWRIGEACNDGDLPGLIALRLLTDELKSRARLDGRAAGLFGALGQLLADTRKFPDAPATYIFQHFTLGSRGFAETYNLPPAFESPSFIREYDRPALSGKSLGRLKSLRADGLRVSIITARPSLAPRDLTPQPWGYAPEAEMAARLVGLTETPSIGYGRMEWLGAAVGRHPEELLKPSPIHALAAIGAALSGQEVASLRAAHRLVERGEVDPLWRGLVGSSLALHVFEDSAGGVRSVQAAGDVLRSIGVQAGVHAWGVTTHAEKKAALERLGARVFEDVNGAMEEAEQRLRGR